MATGVTRQRANARKTLLVLGALFALLPGAQPAWADVSAPDVPRGYVANVVGHVRWVYPPAAAGEVEDLQALTPRAWPELERLLGAPITPELDIRVGVDFDAMQALAPQGVRLPSHASGVALSGHGIILLSLTDPRSFRRPDIEDVLVHELSHVALHRAVEGHPIPRWFTEGVAIYHAGEHSLERIRTLWDGALRGHLLPLAALDRGFSERHGDVDLAYAQSADIVRFLVEGEDAWRFRKLVRGIRDGARIEDAVGAAYGVPLDQIERDWRAGVERRFGRWPSFLAGMTSLWALAAILLVVAYVRVRRKHARALTEWAAEEARVVAPPPIPVLERAPPPAADVIFDALEARRRLDPEIPTVVHEGESHTLH